MTELDLDRTTRRALVGDLTHEEVSALIAELRACRAVRDDIEQMRKEAWRQYKEQHARAERAGAEVESLRYLHGQAHDDMERMAAAIAHVEALLPKTCGAPYCGPCHSAVVEIRAALRDDDFDEETARVRAILDDDRSADSCPRDHSRFTHGVCWFCGTDLDGSEQ